jgi:ribosomal protein S18 acetylase RimI-like enzyme
MAEGDLGGAGLERLSEVTHFVPDIGAARKWLEAVLRKPPVLSEAHLVQFEVGGARITLHPADGKSPAGVAGQVAYWRARKLDDAIQWLAAHGAQLYRGPVVGPDGLRVCQMLDPFGNAWGLVEPLAARVAPVHADDRPWLARLWRREWGGDTQEYEGRSHHVDAVDALIAWRGDRRVGAATFVVRNVEAELVTLNAEPRGEGIGSLLLQAFEARVAEQGAVRAMLVTTNDNLEALRLYQRYGYRLEALRVGAVDRARHQKPAIPLLGHHGIALHDELVLAKPLDAGRG